MGRLGGYRGGLIAVLGCSGVFLGEKVSLGRKNPT